MQARPRTLPPCVWVQLWLQFHQQKWRETIESERDVRQPSPSSGTMGALDRGGDEELVSDGSVPMGRLELMMQTVLENQIQISERLHRVELRSFGSAASSGTVEMRGFLQAWKGLMQGRIIEMLWESSGKKMARVCGALLLKSLFRG